MSEIPAGAMRFNSDSQKLEYWNGSAWFQVHTATPDLASAGDSTPGARGLFYRGYGGSNTNEIDYINFASTGNAIDFGNALSSNRVEVVQLDQAPEQLLLEEMLQIIRLNLLNLRLQEMHKILLMQLRTARSPAAMSNGTRGVFAGGYSGPSITNLVEYITIASEGVNAQDFGDLTVSRSEPSRAQSKTRGVIGSGRSSPNFVNTIDFITLATLGDAQDFGDATVARSEIGSDSNPIRGIFAGGQTPGTTSVIDFVTIATTGNAQDFGDVSTSVSSTRGSASSTRMVFNLGYNGSSYVNSIEYVEIMTEGNSVDFGDLQSAKGHGCRLF